MQLYSILSLIVFLQSVYAHFELIYPPSRGYNESAESQIPCGGASSAVGNRTQMPLKDAFLQIYSSHPVYIYGISLVAKSNPILSDFRINLTSIGSGDRNYPGESCLPIDFSLVPVIASGTNATIQVQYNGGDGILYQCTDVVLTNSATNWNSSACRNASDTNRPDNLTSAAIDSSSPLSTLHFLFSVIIGLYLFFIF
ncbi:hypothetical protein EDC96DRAFT_454806 [Choanephora cucurbitarum]|nr:hypothetical protein EDC96DRAFT_454806 [Choanephora cucurbitarum]